MSCRDAWLAAAACWALLVAGCEQPTSLVPVAGIVLLDGKPLTSGVVQFQPASGQAASGQIAADGSFLLSRNAPGDGVPPGTYRVAVISYDPRAETDAVENLQVPVKYTRFGSSGIEFTVFPGAIEPLVIELVSAASVSAGVPVEIDSTAAGNTNGG